MLTLTLVVSFVYAQNDYYWSAGKKHFITPQAGVFIIKLEQEVSFPSAIDNLKSDGKIKSLTKVKRDIGIVFTKDSVASSKELKAYKEFSNAIPVYQLGICLSSLSAKSLCARRTILL